VTLCAKLAVFQVTGMARGLTSRFWDRLFGSVDRRERLDSAKDPTQGAIKETL